MARRLKLGGQLLAVALVAGLFALLVWKVVNQQRDNAAKDVRAGKVKPAPAFHLPRLDTGGKLALASLRGKAVVLNFWQSSCDPCKTEAPALERTWQKYRNQGLVVVGVDVYDFSSDARKFAREYGLTYPLVHDVSGGTIDTYGLTGYPETFFVDRRGRLVPVHLEGPIDKGENKQEFERAIALALRA
jgi:cytochrome c biogenesis protein CcmG, thiol:disulfide interchange protein DsbE